MPRISEEMRQWSALIEAETLSWPGVQAKPMFGMLAFYRKGQIFAAVPRTRGLGSERAVIFKLKGAPESLVQRVLADARVSAPHLGGAGWIAFSLDSVDDAREALRWFSEAYELATDSKKKH